MSHRTLSEQEINHMFGVTTEELDAEAKEYEDGSWEGVWGPVTPGRPRLYDEDMGMVSFKLPPSRIKQMDRLAKQRGQTRSQFLRQAVNLLIWQESHEAEGLATSA